MTCRKNYLGDEYEYGMSLEKREWIEKTFKKTQYRYRYITSGFLIEEYYVEFFDDSCQTLYDLKFSQ